MLSKIAKLTLLVTVCGLLASIAFVIPSYATAVTKAHSYQIALAVTTQDEASLSESFGRQLDTLTSLYSTVITVLSVLLAAVGGFAVFASRARAAETARDEAKAYRDSDEYKALLRQEIQQAVEKRLAEILAKFTALGEKMQELYEENDLQVIEPDDAIRDDANGLEQNED